MGGNCKIGAFTSIGGDVVIGDGTEISPYCEIGIDSGLIQEQPLMFGTNSAIRSGKVIG